MVYFGRSYYRVAVVTGSNRGIGLEIVRQLATEGVTVVLAARDEKKGIEAASSLHQLGLPSVVFHQLDVQDPVSIESLAKFIKDRFGRLDILVNNAGASGVQVDVDGLKALNIDPQSWLSGKATNMVQSVIIQTYEKGVECLNVNYYGCKRVAEALLPLLELSAAGASIVNVTSLRGELRVSEVLPGIARLLWASLPFLIIILQFLDSAYSGADNVYQISDKYCLHFLALQRVPNEKIRNELADIETLTVEKVDKIVEKFLQDLKDNALEANGWSLMLPSYSVSKVTLNAYTRVLAKKYPNMCINCVHPGFVKTELNWNTGTQSVAEGARGPVMLALLPTGGPTGCYFDQTLMAQF
ncbi:Short-chain dehydrogenase/reductase SDR [Dillenia turbinata]|uniref:Short-chain dehydrogenase/reductase SDR n=1 Tax=Dillenia turbinata TaxID=194707 RepID=A0AAN8ZFY2_9MAGN